MTAETKLNMHAFSHTKTDHTVRVDGKFFCQADHYWPLRGLAYGPLVNRKTPTGFAPEAQTRADFEQIRDAGVNTLRVYEVPPMWFMDLAEEKALKLWIDIPWNQQHLFLENATEQRLLRKRMALTLQAFKAHPALMAICIGNEIPSELIRWQGVKKVTCFLDELADQVHQIHPQVLCTYGNYPPTEYLQPKEIDFVTFNIYLHDPACLDRYLARLQLIANGKPLVVGEFGMDTLSEGKEAQATYLKDQLRVMDQNACAGSVVFSFTDEWYKDGRIVSDWAFGVTHADRTPKPSFEALRSHYDSEQSVLTNVPLVSVIVAAHNGGKTLTACLKSLETLDYPNYEVLVINDGSTDDTLAIAASFSSVTCIDLGSNRGLSAARNAGIKAAKGAIVAFTDADCQADARWLHYLVASFEKHDWSAVGGPNLLPRGDGPVAAAVMMTPGGPSHVMLSDQIAEHIPGCNMAFRSEALKKVGGFDPQFRVAGDDVDLCWRLLKRSMVIGFAPGAFVWHHRRPTIAAFVGQQLGYGRAESLLCRKFPSMFNMQGDHVWRGRIYDTRPQEHALHIPKVYHGLYGMGAFQPLYGLPPSRLSALLTSVDYHLQTTLPLLIAGTGFPWLAGLACINLVITILVAGANGFHAPITSKRRRWWSRGLLMGLYLLQPFSRSFARLEQWMCMRGTGNPSKGRLEALSRTYAGDRLDKAVFWNIKDTGRPAFFALLKSRLAKAGWHVSLNNAWATYDAWMPGGWCFDLQIHSVEEFFKDPGRCVSLRTQPVPTFMAHTAWLGLLGLTIGLCGIMGLTGWYLAILVILWATSWFAYRQLRQKLLAKCLAELIETAETLDWSLLTTEDNMAKKDEEGA